MGVFTDKTWEIVTDDGSSPARMGECLCIQTEDRHIAFVFNDAPDIARLIVNAPELLAALKSVTEALEEYAFHQGIKKAFRQLNTAACARKVINQVEGS